ncbi:MAG: hypothetical protein ACK4PI_09820 [Tepidisphaerales bacterium]
MIYRFAAAAVVLGMSASASLAAVELYPANAPLPPTAYGWLAVSQAPAPAAVPTPWPDFTIGAGQSVLVSTMADRGGYGGLIYTGVPLSPTQNTLQFHLSLVSSEVFLLGVGRRAGLSLLLLNGDARGVELGFWPDRIFSQEVGFFAIGEEVLHTPFDPTNATAYYLTLLATTYELRMGSTLLLTGPLRDYSATPTVFGPVYSQSNFLFIGDNTTRGAASFDFGRMAVVPEPAAVALLGPASVLLLRRRRVR